jgi:metal-sulfur cluster biosynthetic enzyme
MRTTINIDDQLLMYAKLQATQQGCTLKQVVEDALREFFSRHNLERSTVKLETVAGAGLTKKGVRPSIKIRHIYATRLYVMISYFGGLSHASHH